MSAETARWDVRLVVAAALALATAIAYLVILRAEGDSPPWWFVGPLAVAVVLLCHAARSTPATRSPAAATAGVLLVCLGLVGLMSIGLPLLVAGVLALVTAARRGRDPAPSGGERRRGRRPPPGSEPSGEAAAGDCR